MFEAYCLFSAKHLYRLPFQLKIVIVIDIAIIRYNQTSVNYYDKKK